MADVIRKVDYWYVTVPQKAGEGTRVLGALSEAGVDLRAVHAFPSARRAQIDLVPADGAKLKAAARKAGLELSERKRAFLVEGDDRVGAAAELTRKLGDAGINITALDAVATGAGRFGALFWVSPEDYTRAARLLGAV